MPYLVADDLPRDSAGKRFRALLQRPEILQLPGAHNGMAALQAKGAGFVEALTSRDAFREVAAALHAANRAQAKLYAALRRDGSAQAMLPEMQTRAELYEMIGLRDYEALDASIVETVLPS
jgi:2-methylisocitrate lyase-like PEP mutase family enzyme